MTGLYWDLGSDDIPARGPVDAPAAAHRAAA
jgi:hypothetical protein